MAEARWGESWLPGARVKVFHRHGEPPAWHTGVIAERSWGRDKGRAIYWFNVVMDGVAGTWVFGPGQLFPEDHPT